MPKAVGAGFWDDWSLWAMEENVKTLVNGSASRLEMGWFAERTEDR
jgi:hypothetical protein